MVTTVRAVARAGRRRGGRRGTGGTVTAESTPCRGMAARRVRGPGLRGRRPVPVLVLSMLLAGLLSTACADPEERQIEARLSVAAALGEDPGEGYARATRLHPFQFPADHGPHPAYRTEWWYFTGHLVAVETTGPDGEPRRFGYQLTFFRTAVAPPQDAEAPGGASGGDAEEEGDDTGGPGDLGATIADPASDWRTRQVYMAHFALTDVAGQRFFAAERFSRGAAGLAGAEADPFRVWTGSWSARDLEPGREVEVPSETGGTSTGSGAGDFFPLHLVAADGGPEGVPFAIDLRLLEGKGRVLQGELGLSRKGPEAGNASYYYTYPRMPTRGTVTVGDDTFRVEGASWLDREWSTSVLGEGQAGWDWFALQLDGAGAAGGREVVFYRIRDAAEAGTEAEGSGPLDYAALVPPDPDDAGPGRLRVLETAGATLEVTDRWTSPTSGVTYPSGWRLRLPAAGLDLRLRPRLRDQELNLAFRYWEGAVVVDGTMDGEPVTGQGYAELTGYGDAAGRTR